MKPILRATFLIVIFLAFNGLLLWQDNIANFLQANVSRFLPQQETKIIEVGNEPVSQPEETEVNKNSTTSNEKIGADAPVFSFAEEQEQLDDISEKIDIVKSEIDEFAAKNTKKDETEKQEEIKDKEIIEVGQDIGQEFCEINSDLFPLPNSIVFKEIAWMGSTNSSNDEWIELKNVSNQEIDLENWQILSQSGNIKFIFPKIEVKSGGILLLERTNDNSVPKIKADFIYTGALKNNNEALYLFDDKCQARDMVQAKSDWPAGDNESKRTMERKAEFEWQTSQNPGGTPKAENSPGFIEVLAIPPGGGAMAPPAYPKILISEIQIASQNSEKDDFAELYNPNDQDIDLTDWHLQRKTKTATDFSTYVKKDLLSGKIISAKNYFLVANASSSFSADATTTYPLTEDNTIYLKNPNGEVSDKVGWGLAQDFEATPTVNAETGKSIGRKWSSTTENYIDTDNNQDDFEIQTPTPKEKNKPLENQIPTALFVFSPQNPFVGDKITLNAASSSDSDGQISTYLWDFGDNTLATTNLSTTTHSFAFSGDFIISLSVVDNLGATSSPATTAISISQKPALSVVINEIAWMGKATSSADEWLELYNNTDSDINLSNWKILKGGQDFITFATSEVKSLINATISTHQYYLLERTDDSTVENIPADLIYTGSLNNSGEKLELEDADGNLINLIDCLSDWFAGDNITKQTMEIIDSTLSGNEPNNWKNSHDPGGTPKAKNSVS